MARLPKSFTSTPEEDEFFAKEKAASVAAETEEPEVEESEPEEATEEATAPDDEEAAAPDDEEATSDEEPATSDDEAAPRTVPLGALHEERERRRQLQSKIDQMESTFAKLVDRINQQPPTAPLPAAPAAPAIPTYEDDPVAHLKARIDALTQLSAGTHQHIQQQGAMAQFVDALSILENQIRTTTTDYDAAIDFAKRARDSELAALGFSPEVRASKMRDEILSTAAYCMQRGQNPVEAFYNYAKVRGWKGPNGALAPAPTTPARKLATVARAQSASRSIPRGGTAPRAAVTLADLATMEDDEFDKHFDKVMRKT